MNSKMKDGRIDLSDVGLSEDDIKNISQVIIVACGSAYHTGVVTQYVMEDLARIPVRVELASEFRYRKPILNKNDLVIVVSQSGETADTLAGLRLAKDQGVKTLGIVNVVGSSIAREADNVFYTMAGPEIAVATTKAYSAQLIAGYMLSIGFARVRGQITDEQYTDYIAELETIASISITKEDAGYQFGDNCVFINFNYTDTLRKRFGVDEMREFHIHGEATDKKSIVFGHNRHPQEPETLLATMGGRFWGLHLVDEILYETDKHCQDNIQILCMFLAMNGVMCEEIKDIYVLAAHESPSS